MRAELERMAGEIEELRSFSVGLDLGLAEDNADVVVIAEFDDVAGYETYRDHPRHRAVIDEMIRPHLRSRTATQVEAAP